MHSPLYPRDFNPIDNAFSKLRAVLYRAATGTVEDLRTVIANTRPCFKAQKYVNYFTVFQI